MNNPEEKYRETVAEQNKVEAADRSFGPVIASPFSCANGVETVPTPGLASDRIYQLAAVTAGIILLATLL